MRPTRSLSQDGGGLCQAVLPAPPLVAHPAARLLPGRWQWWEEARRPGSQAPHRVPTGSTCLWGGSRRASGPAEPQTEPALSEHVAFTPRSGLRLASCISL